MNKPVPMKLFAAWEVEKRTPPNCIPRYTHNFIMFLDSFSIYKLNETIVWIGIVEHNKNCVNQFRVQQIKEKIYSQCNEWEHLILQLKI